MKALGKIYQKEEVLLGLQQSFDEVANTVLEMKDQLVFQSHNNKWTVIENLDHLIRSTKGIASALKTNKLILRATFGTAKRPSISLDELYVKYKTNLVQGLVAGGEFLPAENGLDDKTTLLKNWKMIGQKFQQRLENWSESDLDTYQLPHPALGKLTLREILFFTIFHNRHHLKAIEKIKGELANE